MSDSDFPPASLRPIAAELAELLKSKDQSVAVAETVRYPSCRCRSASLTPCPGGRRSRFRDAAGATGCLQVLPRRLNPLHAPISCGVRRLDAGEH